MNKKDLDLKSLGPMFKKLKQGLGKHAVFVAVMLVLATYLFMVWKIEQLSNAEPPDQDVSASATKIPKINKTAVDQIQSLEQSSPQVQSLFDSARNNPFEE